jgi:transcriptional regulator with XRE-family HTH domain
MIDLASNICSLFLSTTRKRLQRNEAVRALRKIIGLTQAEFAVMTGVSKDAVVSREIGWNGLSATYARRIALVTGVDGRGLRLGVSVPISQDAAGRARLCPSAPVSPAEGGSLADRNSPSARQAARRRRWDWPRSPARQNHFFEVISVDSVCAAMLVLQPGLSIIRP